MLPTLTHLALQVRDLEASVAFYREFCRLEVVHERPIAHGKNGERVVWLAERGRERELVFVLMPGGKGREPAAADYSHLGFALESKADVDATADKARKLGCLLWEPREDPYPVGYYCGVRDPDGNAVEFSYGQPLGPGGRLLGAASADDP